MTDLINPIEYQLDTLFVKFASLPKPAIIPWIEVASGRFVPEESTPEQFVFLTKAQTKAKVQEEGVVTERDAEEPSLEKTHLKKKDLIAYLNDKLREPLNPEVVDYGPVEDFCMQPAGHDMTKEVFLFLAKYGAV